MLIKINSALVVLLMTHKIKITNYKIESKRKQQKNLRRLRLYKDFKNWLKAKVDYLNIGCRNVGRQNASKKGAIQKPSHLKKLSYNKSGKNFYNNIKLHVTFLGAAPTWKTKFKQSLTNVSISTIKMLFFSCALVNQFT